MSHSGASTLVHYLEAGIEQQSVEATVIINKNVDNLLIANFICNAKKKMLLVAAR